jgi:hypothetical protein
VRIACLCAGYVCNVGCRQFPRHGLCCNGLPQFNTATSVPVILLSETYCNFGTTREVEVAIGNVFKSDVLRSLKTFDVTDTSKILIMLDTRLPMRCNLNPSFFRSYIYFVFF